MRTGTFSSLKVIVAQRRGLLRPHRDITQTGRVIFLSRPQLSRNNSFKRLPYLAPPPEEHTMAVANQLLTACTESNMTRYAANLERLRQGRKRRLDSAGTASSGDENSAVGHEAWARKALRLDLEATANNNISATNNNRKSVNTDVSTENKEESARGADSRRAQSPGSCQSTPLSSATSPTATAPSSPAVQSRSVSPSTADLDCRRLPIMKRYLRSVLAVDSASSSTCEPPPASPTTAPATSLRLSTPTVKEPCLRAGVIRHSSNPQRCLAFYYMPKHILC